MESNHSFLRQGENLIRSGDTCVTECLCILDRRHQKRRKERERECEYRLPDGAVLFLDSIAERETNCCIM